jgi:release factor glutamine methyltransferase
MEFPRRLCRRLAHLAYRPYVLWRIRRPSRATVRGRDLFTDPEVFHPVLFHSTRILIDYLATLDLAGKRFLDMGTGSGSVGIFAAGRGARVTACDVNPRAVALAAENARHNGVAAEVVESNLFAALPGREFDVICFNVPFYPRTPSTPFEAAFFAGPGLETVRRFAADCPRFLASGGTVVVLFSEDSDARAVLSMFEGAGLSAVAETITSRLFERFHILRLQRGRA